MARLARTVLVALLAPLLLGAGLAACDDTDEGDLESAGGEVADDTALPGPGATCSAGSTDVAPEPGPGGGDLPTLLSTQVDRIAGTAQLCDLEQLADFAVDDGFVFDFEDYTEPEPLAEAWLALEQEEIPVLGRLVRLLEVSPAVTEIEGETVYVWPEAQVDPDAPGVREELDDLFGEDLVAEWFTGEGYVGPRTAFAEDGDWLYYVFAGD